MSYRTVTFRSVFEAIARRHGLDPKGDAITSDAGLSMVERINARVKRGWFYWEAPDITACEERAFRQIWNNSRQFYHGDEVFYIPTMSYYVVKTATETDVGNPPIGNPPTDVTYWDTLDLAGGYYIEYDQICKKPIGDVLAVYGANPTTVRCAPCLGYQPSGRGIEVTGGYYGPTVFLRYLMQVERFTTLPYIATKTYNRGDLVYVWTTGECYQALTTALNKYPPGEPDYWRQALFPEFLESYVKAGVYADTLRESDTSGERDPVMLQLRGQNADKADAEAEMELITRINRWQAQGQHYCYQPYGYRGGWWPSYPGYPWPQGANGTSIPVTTLTDICECDGSYAPAPAPTPPSIWEYHNEIDYLRTSEGTPSLAGLDTTRKNVGSKVEIAIEPEPGAGKQGQAWQLTGGPADPDDSGHVAPDDYAQVSNNKHWVRIE
jgi:hypothetical protein